MIVTRAYITELEVREDQRQSVGVAVPHGVQIRVGRYLETFCPARSPTHPPAPLTPPTPATPAPCPSVSRSADELLFIGSRGGIMRAQTFQRAALTQAAEQIGVRGFHPHELRHTAASLAIASGADVKVVQQMFGHKSATMTLDLYGHLFGDRLDVVADAMDLARSAALADVYPLCTGAEVVPMAV